MKNLSRIAWITAVAALVLVPAGQAMDNQVTPVQGGDSLSWNLDAPNARGFVLTVSHPDGVVTRHEFGAGDTVQFSLFRDDQGLSDGLYVYEIRESIKPTAETTAKFADARRGEPTSIQAGSRQLPEGQVWSGVFRVMDGSFFVPRDEPEPRSPGMQNAAAPNMTNATAADQVIPDDLIVQRSLCVGFDCVNGEDFGFDTIRLKENNLRIKFQDTSAGSFPTRDWEIEANSTANGGASYFRINDVDGARSPFTIEAGTPSHTLYVDSAKRVGIGTSAPVLELHVSDGDSPGLRLEQNTSSGFQSQIWDIAGNETNFFVRDATSGSTLPFRIFPGSPSSSLVIRDGDVGMGTASPAEKLHLVGSDSPRVLIEDTTDNANDKPGFVLRSPAATASGDWAFETDNGGSFQIDFRPSPGPEVLITDVATANGSTIQLNGNVQTPAGTTMTVNGNLTVNGTFSNPSSKALKKDFAPVDTLEILQRLADLPITEWSYISDESGRRHIGPFTEDFGDTFGLGTEGKNIIPLDVQGVTIAAVQGLYQTLVNLERQNAMLLERLRSLEEELAAKDE